MKLMVLMRRIDNSHCHELRNPNEGKARHPTRTLGGINSLLFLETMLHFTSIVCFSLPQVFFSSSYLSFIVFL
jgi:hypothetical protein